MVHAGWILNALTTTTRRRCRIRNGGVKTAAWRTFRRRSTLHHAVKNKLGTVQGPVKKPPMDYTSTRGAYPPPPPKGTGCCPHEPQAYEVCHDVCPENCDVQR